MEDKKKIEELKRGYLSVYVPEGGFQEMKKKIDLAKMDKKRAKRNRKLRYGGLTVAAAALALVVLPNANADVAMAMQKLPVIGQIVNVVTFDRYRYVDEHNSANVEIPQLDVVGGTDATTQVNDDIKNHTDLLIQEFEHKSSEAGEGYTGLDVTWDVVTDNTEWFTLRINILEVQASGYEHFEFYHINKSTGEITQLKDLFKEESDYVGIITEDIKNQMNEIMENESLIYFVDEFDTIKENQNFYFNKENQIVIVFDEYEVAPGYMGSVEFVIDDNLLKDILK